MTAVPTGVFDSGVGGLSILSAIQHLLPAEQLLYVADSAHAPYGPKGDAFIRARCDTIMRFFLEQRVKAVVVACNTATAAAVADMRAKYSLPIIGVEPALKPAATLSRSAVVGVLATSGTIASDKFLHLQSRFTAEVEIITRACPGLVEHIEQGMPDEAALRALLRTFIDPLLERKADTLVLGCTHYSLVRDMIRDIAGAGVTIVDAGAAVAKELQRRLPAQGPDTGQREGGIRFFTSGDPQLQQALVARYWGSEVEVEVLPE
jgi:glutamate racemase